MVVRVQMVANELVVHVHDHGQLGAVAVYLCPASYPSCQPRKKLKITIWSFMSNECISLLHHHKAGKSYQIMVSWGLAVGGCVCVCFVCVCVCVYVCVYVYKTDEIIIKNISSVFLLKYIFEIKWIC